jgi:hypothetical protein
VDNRIIHPQESCLFLGILVWIEEAVCGLAQFRHLRSVDKWIVAVDNDRGRSPGIPRNPPVLHCKKIP